MHTNDPFARPVLAVPLSRTSELEGRFETDQTAVEVMILWGSNVLCVRHLSPARCFIVGEEGPGAPVDFLMPKEVLGTPRLELVSVHGGQVSVTLPASAEGELSLPGGTQANHALTTLPVSEALGQRQVVLPEGARASLSVGPFVVRVAMVRAAQATPRTLLGDADRSAVAYFGASFAAIGSLVASMAFFIPPMGLLDDESIDRDRVVMIQAYLNSAAEREQDRQEEVAALAPTPEQSGGQGERAQGAEGKMGKQTAANTAKRVGIKGPKDNPDPHLAREQALREATTDFGMLGLLNPGAQGDPKAPTAPWGRDTSLGLDDESAMGNMFGDEIGESFGGGLGLTGGGSGAGGRGEGIGLGELGFGRGAGTGLDGAFGNGLGRSRLRGHDTKAPTIRTPHTEVTGRLPPEVVQRIVRQNYGRFRLCYEQGLLKNPNLEGRVAVRFAIGGDGAVSAVSNGGSDLPDSGVVGCVVSAFYGLSFPPPDGGIVRVVYPIMFSPG